MILYGGGTGLVRTPLDETNMTGVLALTHANYSWVSDANAFWSGVYIKRYSRGILRLPNWTLPFVAFEEICTTRAFSDMEYAVFVDGVRVAAVQGSRSNTLVRATHSVSITPAVGGSTVEVWATWGTIPGSQGTGADAPVEGGFPTAVWTPFDYTFAKAQATTAIITLTDSIFGAAVSGFTLGVDQPEIMGVAGQLRLLAQAKGWLLIDLGYGGATACGDGITAAQRAQLTIDAATSAGATSVKVVINYGHNDSVNATATAIQVTTYIQQIIDALPASYEKHVLTPIVATTEGTLPSYSSNQVSNLARYTSLTDGHNCGLVPASDLFDGVHCNDGSGVPKLTAVMRVPLGL